MGRSRSFGTTATLLLPLCIPALTYSAPVPTTATRALMDAKPGIKGLVVDGRLSALYGAPLANMNEYPAATTTDEFVAAFLADPAHGADSFGVDNLSLSLIDQIIIRGGEMTVYSYQQQIEGLPVHGAVVRLPVLHGVPDKIVHAGVRIKPHPAAALPADVVTAAGAITNVQQSQEYGHLTDFDLAADAVKVIYEDDTETLHRAWRFFGWDDDEDYLFFVDTNSGAIVAAEDRLLDGDVSGEVTGFATPGFSPDADPSCLDCCAVDPSPGPGEPCCLAPTLGQVCYPAQDDTFDPVAVAMGGVELTIAGQPAQFAIDDDALPATYSFSGLTEGVGVTVNSTLIGEWVSVEDVGGYDATASQTATPTEVGVDLVYNEPVCRGGTRDGLTCDPLGTPETECPGGGVCDDWIDLEFDTAQVNVFLAVQATHDWFSILQPEYDDIDTSLRARVNVPGWCNASAAGERGLRFGAASTGCASSAFSSIISHEYGHFIHQSHLLFYGGAFAEGFADAVSTLMWDNEMNGLGWRLGREVPYLRNVDEPDVRLYDPGSFPTWCSSGRHCHGLALAGAFWDLRKQLLKCNDGTNPGTSCASDDDCLGGGICNDDSETERIFADFLFITAGLLGDANLVEVLIADDDDGDLTTASPHQFEIENAFSGTGTDKHGWPLLGDILCDPVPGESIHVEWFGVGGTPTEGTDYYVHRFIQRGICRPHITLKTTEVASQDVERWTIGRTISGVPAEMGTITADWDGPAHDITVEIGTDLSANIRGLDFAEIPAQSSATWSSLVLQVGGACLGGTNEGDPCEVNADCDSSNCSAGNLQRNCVGFFSWDIPCNVDSDCDYIGTCNAGSLQQVSADASSATTGGRISGTVSGVAGGIVAEAIGSGASLPGYLNVSSRVSAVDLGAIPTGSTLSFDWVHSSLDIEDELQGTIQVHGDWTGTCGGGPMAGRGCAKNTTDCIDESIGGVFGCFASYLTIHGGISGTGEILVEGDISPYVVIDITGDVALGGKIHAGGEIDGLVQVSGTFNGDICGTNLFPEEALPWNIQITLGSTGTICGGCADTGVQATTPTEEEISDGEGGTEANIKNRFISFDGQDPGIQTAIRVTFVDLPSPFDIWNGSEMWVGDPSDVSEISTRVVPDEGDQTFQAAMLQCGPRYKDWAALGTVHVFHEAIVPGGTYELQAVECGNASYENLYSDPLTIYTATWGDTVRYCVTNEWCLAADGEVAIEDILAIVSKFGNATGALSKSRADFMGTYSSGDSSCLDFEIELSDVTRAISAFSGTPYEFTLSDPDPCNSPCVFPGT